MDIFAELIKGFEGLLNFNTLFFCFLGVLLGQIIGALPGIGPSAGCAILLPVAFSMDPKNALIMLCGIYYGAMYGGTVTSVLLNIPGESSAVISALEGFKLAKKGRGGVTLGIAAIGSFIAGTLGVIALSFFAPMLAEKALLFGPAEKFAVIAMSFAFISSLQSGGSTTKGIIALLVGLLLASFGKDVITGVPRLVFGTDWLLDGFDFVPLALGFFALAEIVATMETSEKVEEISVSALGRVLPSVEEIKSTAMPIARGSLVGFVCGLVPGAGSTVAVFLSYGVEKRYAKHPEEFGNGSLEAVAATESANNSCAAGHMVPLMSLAIPGTATTAILLSGFMMFGLQPGPTLFTQHPDIAWAIIASMYMGNVMLVIMNMAAIPFFVWIVKKATPFIVPLVISLTVAGGYSVTNSMSDIWIVFGSGVAGYILVKLKYPLVSILLGVVLGGMAETNFRQALRISDGSLMTFIEKPISAGMLLVGLLMLLGPVVTGYLRKKRAARHA
jgi:putative tricarboxylic transport membrane protein